MKEHHLHALLGTNIITVSSLILVDTNTLQPRISVTTPSFPLSLEKFGIELPIVKAVHEVLFENKAPMRAIRDLMSRVPRSEADPER